MSEPNNCRGMKRALSPENAATEDGGASVKRARAATVSVALATSTNTSKDVTSTTIPGYIPNVSVVQTQHNNTVKPQYSGTFDLYSMDLPFLKGVYAPNQNAEQLYKTILSYQARNDKTAQVIFPADITAVGSQGEFICDSIIDPMIEFPFELISASSIKEFKRWNFKSKFGRPTQGEWTNGGIKAKLQLAHDKCGINSSSGNISIRPLWRKVDTDGKVMELFEGTFTFRVKYGSMYSKAGMGTGQRTTIDFWAVRRNFQTMAIPS